MNLVINTLITIMVYHSHTECTGTTRNRYTNSPHPNNTKGTATQIKTFNIRWSLSPTSFFYEISIFQNTTTSSGNQCKSKLCYGFIKNTWRIAIRNTCCR